MKSFTTVVVVITTRTIVEHQNPKVPRPTTTLYNLVWRTFTKTRVLFLALKLGEYR